MAGRVERRIDRAPQLIGVASQVVTNADDVDDVRGRELPAAGDHRASRRHGPLSDSFGLHLVPAAPLDRRRDRRRHEQALVGRNDDGIDLKLGDLPLPDLDLDGQCHGASQLSRLHSLSPVPADGSAGVAPEERSLLRS